VGAWVALLGGALLLAGCAGTPARASSAAPVHTAEVTMPPSYRFEPASIQVAAGTTVTFRNTDNFTHSVQVQGQPDRQVKPGESVQIAFATPGEYPYVCTLHAQNMKGTVTVADR
jgi:plastocyanin